MTTSNKTTSNINPASVWEEYKSGTTYKNQINLYDNVEFNENFYLGKQWEGVNAPDIEKPVINICKQAVDYSVSNLVSDDIGINVDLPKELSQKLRDALEYIINHEITKVIEQTKFKSKSRMFMRNCAVDGDAFLHWRYDTDRNLRGKYKGEITVELLDNTNVIFGDPSTHDVESQPYIITVSKFPVEKVKRMVRGDQSEVHADSEDYNQQERDAVSVSAYATVLTRLWKENGTVWFSKTTAKSVIVPPTDTGRELYPIVNMSWKRVKNSYHGVALITEIRQNQIMINKYFMMANEWVKKVSFPKVMYDMTKVPNWSNSVEALGVNGIPKDAIAVATPTMELGQGVTSFFENLLQKSKEVMGMFDATLGNVRPENTSAIIALQKTASQPLELQRLDYYQVVEDSVRIIVDIMANSYGEREVAFRPKGEDEDKIMPFDFKDLKDASIGINVDVGASAYWSEITKVQTLDNLYHNQIIPDPITYLEQLPAGILPEKNAIIEAIKAQQQAMMDQMNAQPQPGQPPVSPNGPVSQPQYMGGSTSPVPATTQAKKVL